MDAARVASTPGTIYPTRNVYGRLVEIAAQGPHSVFAIEADVVNCQRNQTAMRFEANISKHLPPGDPWSYRLIFDTEAPAVVVRNPAALEPGVRYALRLQGQDPEDPNHTFLRTDTVDFVAWQAPNLTYDELQPEASRKTLPLGQPPNHWAFVEARRPWRVSDLVPGNEYHLGFYQEGGEWHLGTMRPRGDAAADCRDWHKADLLAGATSAVDGQAGATSSIVPRWLLMDRTVNFTLWIGNVQDIDLAYGLDDLRVADQRGDRVVGCAPSPADVNDTARASAWNPRAVSIACQADASCPLPCDARLVADLRFHDELGGEHAKPAWLLLQSLQLVRPAQLTVGVSQNATSPEAFLLTAEYQDEGGWDILGASVSARFEGLDAKVQVGWAYNATTGQYEFRWSDWHEWDPGFRAGTYVARVAAGKQAFQGAQQAVSFTLAPPGTSAG